MARNSNSGWQFARFYRLFVGSLSTFTLATAGLIQTTFAVDSTWTFDGDGVWTTDSNWSPVGEPDGSTFNVFIEDGDSSVNVTLNANRTVGSLNIGSDDTLLIPFGRTLEVIGATTVNNLLVLDGGRLITDTLTGPDSIAWSSGELRVNTSAGFFVDPGGPLGGNVNLKDGMFLHAPNGVAITNGVLSVQNGASVEAFIIGTWEGGGQIHLNGPAALLKSVILFNHVVIAGTGTIHGELDNLMDGEISVSFGQALRFVTGNVTHENDGLIRLTEGEMLMSGTLTNKSTGRIEGRGVLRTAGLTNQGHVALSNGITDVFGDVVNDTGTIAKGITVSGNADVTFWDDVNNVVGSLFRVSAGSSATFFGTFSGAGISGGGTVYLEADVTPGASPATATFGGDVNLGSASHLVMEIGGTSQNSYDQLDVTNHLSLAGSLDVELINGYQPANGDTFNVLDWTSRSGTFQTISLPELNGPLAWDTSQLYAFGLLSVVSNGDFNQDGVIDAADYVVWRKNPGGIYTPADFDIWRTNFGNTTGSGAHSDANAAVPEPTSFFILVVGLGMWTLNVRQREDAS